MALGLGLFVMLPKKEQDMRSKAEKVPLVVAPGDVMKGLASEHGGYWVSCVAGHIDFVLRAYVGSYGLRPVLKDYGECRFSQFYMGPRCTRLRRHLYGKVQDAMTAAWQLGGEEAVVALWERPGPPVRKR